VVIFEAKPGPAGPGSELQTHEQEQGESLVVFELIIKKFKGKPKMTVLE
jgi:hypothetical protein